MQAKRIPNTIDEPPIFLFWSADEFIPLTSVLSLGFMSGWLTTSALVAWVVLKFYRKLRDGNPPGHAMHAAWWAGVGGIKNSRTIHNPYIREFRQ
jgi:conjugal transfer pilus assembly protein TraL